MSTSSTEDIWKNWLLNRRFGGDQQLMDAAFSEFLLPIRNRVLEHAALQEGECLLDVGCGDGLIAIGALASTRGTEVIFSDISQPLLDHAADLTREIGLQERCRFVHASADDLSPLADGSVDAVTTRSVLIYVANKQQALREFYRVLRPGGRLSLFEPINRFGYPPPEHIFRGFDISPIQPIINKIKALYNRLQPADDPMLDFDERDLLRLAETAGFTKIQYTLEARVEPLPPNASWDNFLNVAGNPKIPTLAEAMNQVLTPAERTTCMEFMRPLVENGQGNHRIALLYLWATK